MRVCTSAKMVVQGIQIQEHLQCCGDGNSTFHGGLQDTQSAGQSVLRLENEPEASLKRGKTLPLHYIL